MVAGLVRPLDRSVSPWAANAIQPFLVLFLTREFIRVTQDRADAPEKRLCYRRGRESRR
jgi:hypothetical protein